MKLVGSFSSEEKSSSSTQSSRTNPRIRSSTIRAWENSSLYPPSWSAIGSGHPPGERRHFYTKPGRDGKSGSGELLHLTGGWSTAVRERTPTSANVLPILVIDPPFFADSKPRDGKRQNPELSRDQASPRALVRDTPGSGAADTVQRAARRAARRRATNSGPAPRPGPSVPAAPRYSCLRRSRLGTARGETIVIPPIKKGS